MFLGDHRDGGVQREDQSALRQIAERQRPVPAAIVGALSVARLVHIRRFRSADAGRVPVPVRVSGQPSGPERRAHILAVRAEPAPGRAAVLGRGTTAVHGAAVGQTVATPPRAVRPRQAAATATATVRLRLGRQTTGAVRLSERQTRAAAVAAAVPSPRDQAAETLSELRAGPAACAGPRARRPPPPAVRRADRRVRRAADHAAHTVVRPARRPVPDARVGPVGRPARPACLSRFPSARPATPHAPAVLGRRRLRHAPAGPAAREPRRHRIPVRFRRSRAGQVPGRAAHPPFARAPSTAAAATVAPQATQVGRVVARQAVVPRPRFGASVASRATATRGQGRPRSRGVR